MSEHVCTCHKTTCPRHPSQHESGCDLCIAQNLKVKKIPICFFRTLDEDVGTDYSFAAFAAFWAAHQKEQPTEGN